MPALTFALLGVGLLVAPAPVLAQRRLAWLAATRWQPSTDLSGHSRLVAARRALIHRLRLLAVERERERRRAELAALVGALHDEYAAGATVAAAFTAAAALCRRFRVTVERAAALARDGDEVATALAAEAELAPLAVACDLAARSGASLGRILTGVQADLAADQQTYRAVRRALAAPRGSALLLSGLPLVGLAMGSALGAHPQRVLLHSTAGLLALIAGVLLDLAGLAWTLALSRRAVP